MQRTWRRNVVFLTEKIFKPVFSKLHLSADFYVAAGDICGAACSPKRQKVRFPNAAYSNLT